MSAPTSTTPPSTSPSTTTNTTGSLPPEALAFAGRLYDAARTGGEESETLIRLACERGGKKLANLTNEKGDTLLMLSAYHGHTSIVRTLLSHGADPNRLNDRGQSPLAGTVFKNERECIAALLAGGADPRVGMPSAVESCVVFKQEEYHAMFTEQIDRLDREGRGAANGR